MAPHEQPAEDAANKAKSRSVALPPDLWDIVNEKVREKYGDNRSAYFRQLVEQDLAEATPGSGKTVLVDLAKKYHPGLAPELEQLCAGPHEARVNQAKLLARLIETVVNTLRVIDATDRETVREETPIQAEIRRHKLIDGALEAVTDHLVSGGLLERVSEMLKEPSALQRRRQGRERGEPKARG